jgi:acetyltransferase-like isoleucine patch superfamily enzyme
MPKDKFRQEVRNFLKNKDAKYASIKYDMRRMNCAKEWYRYRNPLRMLWTAFVVEVCRKLPPCEFKNYLYRMVGVKIGKDVTICPDVVLDWLFPELITIEDGVLLGGDLFIAAHEITMNELNIGRIILGKQSLIASWTVIDPGVTLGERSIVGLFSWVREDVLPYSFVVGVPAKIKKTLDKESYSKSLEKREVKSEVVMYGEKE